MQASSLKDDLNKRTKSVWYMHEAFDECADPGAAGNLLAATGMLEP